jgi:hypothetical protein
MRLQPASVRVLVVWFGKPQLRDKHRFIGVNLWALKDLKRTVGSDSQLLCPRKDGAISAPLLEKPGIIRQNDPEKWRHPSKN